MYNKTSATIVQLKHIPLIAIAAMNQNTTAGASRVITNKMKRVGTAISEPSAHTKGSACGVIVLNLNLRWIIVTELFILYSKI